VLFGGFYEAMREVALPLQRLSLKLLLTVNPCGAATGAVVQRRVRILFPGPPLGADPTETQRSGELHGPSAATYPVLRCAPLRSCICL
jgi:hypothetical protein